MSSGNSSNSSGSSNSNPLVGTNAFATLPSGTYSTATSSSFGSSLGASLAANLSRLDGIDEATLQSLDQDSIVFNPDDVEDTSFQGGFLKLHETIGSTLNCYYFY